VIRPTVTEYMRRTDAAGLSWSLSEELDDTELERKLFPPPAIVAEQRAMPDWPVVHQELSGKGVALAPKWAQSIPEVL
jgi:transposase